MTESSYTPQRKDLFLGQYVRTTRHGYTGRVVQRHYSCPETADWIASQSLPLTPEQVDGPWVSILVHDGGAIVTPEDSVEVIPRFVFRHRDRDDYFPADDEDDLIDAETAAAFEVEEYELTVSVTTQYRFKTEVKDFYEMRNTIADIWNRQPGINQFGGPTSEGTDKVELIGWDRIK